MDDAGWGMAGALRCGRLLESSSGLVDLATGLPVRVVSSTADDGRPPPAVPGVLDAWRAVNAVGRWVWRVIVSESPSAERVRVEPSTADLWDSGPRGSVLVARVTDHGWLSLAATARAAGRVPVRGDLLETLARVGAPRQCPPVVVGVTAEDATAPTLTAWRTRGGLVDGLVALGDASIGRTRVGGDLQRSWLALARAPHWPSYRWTARPSEGRGVMTHLELLDVSARIDDIRRDADALAAACRAVREHTAAVRAAVLVVASGEARVVVGDAAPPDVVAAWQHLARTDDLECVASARGWHAVGRHALAPERTVCVVATWASQDAGQARAALLTVFARLVGSRVSVPTSASTPPTSLVGTLIGESSAMRDVRAQIALAARAPFPVLIRGESGCGKELAARAIHGLGPRAHRRLATINCAALPDELIESELFGHVRGAFTGAATDRAGLFDEADGGTLFLDEIGDLGMRAQAKLLRVLQDGEIRRVGDTQARRVDVRVIAATHVPLEAAVRRGTFRADLFYRLDVVRVRMPALRERRDDIPLLARHFWQDCVSRVGSRARLEGRVLDVLARYDWPGNVRQLQNTLAAVAVRVPPRGRVHVEDLPPDIRRGPSCDAYSPTSGLEAARREFEATYVREALTRAGGRPSRAARDLGLTRQGLTKLVRRLGLDDDDGAEPPG